MWMYSKRDVQSIVEEFLAKHFNFGSVYLSEESKKEFEKICRYYGTEVENIVEQY